jgi:hypothetical protein
MAIALTGVGIAWMILGGRPGNGTGYGSSGHGDDFDGDDMAASVRPSAYPHRAGTANRHAGGTNDEGGGERTFSQAMRDDDPDWVRGYAAALGTPDDMAHPLADDRAGYDARDLARLAADIVADLGRHAVEREPVLEFVERAGEALPLEFDLSLDLGRGAVIMHGHSWSPP